MTSFSEGNINRDADGKFASKVTGETDASALGTDTPRASVKETAAAMRSDLRKRFPSTKFSVRMDSGSAYGWIDVAYTDGPKYDDVKDVVSSYESSRFDGMDDSYHSTGNTQWSCSGASVNRTFSPEMTQRANDLVTINDDGLKTIDAGNHTEVSHGSYEDDLLAYRWLSRQDLSNGFPDVEKH